MKSDTERKKFYTEKLHKRKNRLHAHLSKHLRSTLKTKKRSILLRKGDKVKIMRGPESGKEAKVLRVNTQKRVVYLEGIVTRTARAKEIVIPIEPSNLLLVSIERTKEREALFNDSAFNKKESKKEEKKETHKSEETKSETHDKKEMKHEGEKKEYSEKKETKHESHKAEEHKKHEDKHDSSGKKEKDFLNDIKK